MRHLPLIIAIGLGASIAAQDAPTTAPAAAAAPALSADQVANVLKQLEEIEKGVMQQRGTNLGAIIQKLRSASSSDAAASAFLDECDKLVNIERKEADREDLKRLEQDKEKAKLAEKNEDKKKTGDHDTGLRLGLEYLALTLEVHDVKDLAMVENKIAAFHQSLLSQAKHLKGITGEALMRPVGSPSGNGRRGAQPPPSLDVVIQAYQLQPFMRREDWPLAPADVIAMYDKVMMKAAREKKKDTLGALWDTAITLDASIRKERMFEAEFVLWQQTGYPELKWLRASDLASNGPSAVSGMAEMLKIIKEYPNHPNSPTWIKNLREMVKPGGDAATGTEPATTK